MSNKIGVIDCDSIVFTAFHPNKVLDSTGEPMRLNNKFVYEDKTEEQIRESVNSLMHHILSSGRFTHYIGFIKGRNTIAERLTYNSQYKANRNAEQPKFWEFTAAYMIEQWKIIQVNHMEVDDAVNITRLALKDSTIVAMDKDLLALEGTHYNWKKNEFVTISATEADNLFWSDMICGQTGDNIPGLKGKGPKYVEELFKPQIIAHPAENIELHAPKYVRVLQAYYDHYKDFELALEEYRKTYKCLKIKEKYEGFVIPEPIAYEGRVS